MYKQPTFWLLVSITMALSLVTRNIVLSRQDMFHYSKDLPEIMHLVNQAYVDEVQFQKLLPGLYQGALEKVDENASYIPPGVNPQDVSDDLLKKTGLVLRKHSGYAYVLSVLPDSPAAKAGFIDDSYIRDINGKSTRHQSLHQLRHLLANAEEPLSITLVGDKITDEKRVELAQSRYKLPEIQTSVATEALVVKFPAFYRGWKRDLRRAIDRAENQQRIVLDFRGNGNGNLEDLKELAGLFFPKGEIGQLMDREGKSFSFLNPEAGTFVQQHFFLLVDKSTSEAAERFCAALQSLNQGTAVGMNTIGFPMIYEDLPLKSGGVLRLATKNWHLPGGQALTFKGLEPKLEVAVDKKEKAQKEGSDDLFLKKALTAVNQYDISKTLQKAG